MEAVSDLLFTPFQQIALTMLKSAVVRPFFAVERVRSIRGLRGSASEFALCYFLLFILG